MRKVNGDKNNVELFLDNGELAALVAAVQFARGASRASSDVGELKPIAKALNRLWWDIAASVEVGLTPAGEKPAGRFEATGLEALGFEAFRCGYDLRRKGRAVDYKAIDPTVKEVA